MNYIKIAVVFNTIEANRLRKLQPYISIPKPNLVACNQCNYTNSVVYTYCTNCGHPLSTNNSTTILYNVRNKRRTELLRKSEAAILAARLLMYVLSAVSFTGIALLLSQLESKYQLGLFSFISAVLCFILARWSRHKPLTALIVSFIIILTFFVIILFGRLSQIFTTVFGLYSLILLGIVCWLLLKGIQGAYKADLINEEIQIL